MARRAGHDLLEAVATAALAVTLVAGSAFVWIGVPIGGLRLAAELTSDATRFLLIALCGIPTAMVGFGWLLYRLNRVYEALRAGGRPAPPRRSAWLRSSSDARRGRRDRPRALIDVAMTASAWAAIVLMAIWFFFFAELRLASAATPRSHITFDTSTRGMSTAVDARIDYTSTDAAGNQRALRRHVLAFPPGTAFDSAAAGNCQASSQELHDRGLGACPADSKVGGGTLRAIATKPPASTAGTFAADLTIFNSSRPKDAPGVEHALIVVVSVGGRVSAAFVVPVVGNVATEEPPTICSTPGEQPPCPNGELTAKSVEYAILEHTRTVGGRVHQLVTTPPTCPTSGRWTFDEHIEYRDGTVERATPTTACEATPGTAPQVTLGVAPRAVRRCRATRFSFAAAAGGSPLAGATVRFANRRAITDAAGRASIAARLCRPGQRRATIKADGYRKAVATVRVAG